MNYKKFKRILEKLVLLKKTEENINKEFKKISDFPARIHFSEHEKLIVELLKEAVDDEYDWIKYFLYERDMSFTVRAIITGKNGKNIPFRNYKDLYNIIIDKM